MTSLDTPAERSDCTGYNPQGCWNVRCQLGKVCCRTSAAKQQPVLIVRKPTEAGVILVVIAFFFGLVVGMASVPM